MKPLPEITDEQENFRMEQIPGMRPGVVRFKRDPVEQVPVGTVVAMMFRVTGYDPDCDGSLMARMEAVDKDGGITGWEVDCIGLYPESTVVLDDPAELHRLSADA